MCVPQQDDGEAGESATARSKRMSLTKDVAPQASEDKLAAEEVSTAAREGVASLLAVMRASGQDADRQWMCCDALTGICAGNGECCGTHDGRDATTDTGATGHIVCQELFDGSSVGLWFCTHSPYHCCEVYGETISVAYQEAVFCI